jgi:hypothetical protein
MNVDRITLTLDHALGAAVRDAARQAGLSVSAWLARAAADRLRNEILRGALDDWEKESGSLTPAERREAAAILGMKPKP